MITLIRRGRAFTVASRVTRTVSLPALALALAITAHPAAAQQTAAVRVNAALLERYVGEYIYPNGTSFFVARSGDTLFQELPSRRLAYAALSDSLFMLGPVFTAQFVLDSAGNAWQVLSDGVGIEYRLRRKGSPREMPPSPVEKEASKKVRVPRAVLDRYVGTYEYIRGQMQRTDLRVVIKWSGDTLVREGAGPRQVLVPLSPTRFQVANTSFVVEFVLDDAGVTQVMGTGFQQMLARRTSKP